MTLAIDYTSAIFRGSQKREQQLLPYLMQAMRGMASPRVLDLGCGTGTFMLALYQKRNDAELYGVDVSKKNIEVACGLCKATGGVHIKFICADYLKLDIGQFDIIFSDSTLHLIPQGFDSLFSKISKELRSGGRLLATLPVLCPYNVGLFSFRKLLIWIDGKITRKIVNWIAKWVYQNAGKALNDRIEYMFVNPEFIMKRSKISKLKKIYGLQLIWEKNESIMVGKFKHSIFCFEKMSQELK